MDYWLKQYIEKELGKSEVIKIADDYQKDLIKYNELSQELKSKKKYKNYFFILKK